MSEGKPLAGVLIQRVESDSSVNFLIEHDLRANASRLSRGKTGFHFSGSCSGNSRGLFLVKPANNCVNAIQYRRRFTTKTYLLTYLSHVLYALGSRQIV